MNEVKTPKKPIVYYYIVAFLVVFLINVIISRQKLRSGTWFRSTDFS